MVSESSPIRLISFLLAVVAGICDTTTFLSGGNIFSAHVTGNFIVFAAQVLSKGWSAEHWLKLVTFPVFVCAVMLGGWLAGKWPGRYSLLLWEGLLLCVCGSLGILLPSSMYGIVMLTTASMGLQNTFGRLYARETFGPTTIMTGNVVQAALDLRIVLGRKEGAIEAGESLRKLLFNIGGFLTGCMAGALLSGWIGLGAIFVAGGVVLFCYWTGGGGKVSTASGSV